MIHRNSESNNYFAVQSAELEITLLLRKLQKERWGTLSPGEVMDLMFIMLFLDFADHLIGLHLQV